MIMPMSAMNSVVGTVATDMQRAIRASGVNPVAGLDWAEHIPADWPGRALVWKTEDGGESWAGKGAGLPDKDCFFTVLRQGMASTNGGVAFGTKSGSVYLRRDEGETWEEVARHLPTVLSVEFMG